MKVKLEGFRQLEKALAEELPKATARSVLTRAGKAAMEPLRQRMAELAPFDPQDRDEDGNHLNETMITKAAGAKQARQLGTARQEGVVILTGPAPTGKRARSNAGWQERGTSKMAAHAYARPAADAEGPNVIDSIRDHLTDEVGKAKKRIAKKAAKGK